MLTLRGVVLLLLAAPLLAGGAWSPGLRGAALGWFLLAVGLILLDRQLAGGARRFEVTRQHDNRLSLGAQNPIRLLLRNRSARRAQFWLRDEPPAQFGVDQRILAGATDGRGEWQGLYHLQPLRRGDYAFGDINLRWRGPLQLAVRQGRIPAAETVKVYPNLIEVRRYELLLRRNRLQEMGLRASRQFGQGTEFERLREYLPDDDFRRIDWKASARRNRPITSEHTTERSQQVIAVLDTGRMMQSPAGPMAKLDYVVNAVLLLAFVAAGKGDRVGMMAYADQVSRYLSPRQGRGQFYRMLELLYGIEPQPVESDVRRAIAYLERRQRRRALVVIFTDLSAGGDSLKALAGAAASLARASLPLVVTISDPEIVAAARHRPGDSQAVYQRAAAVQLLDERRAALDQMRRQGVLCLDTPANQLSTAVINRYLELKARTLL
jgi:uncharacterized protein (DUF58 family)